MIWKSKYPDVVIPDVAFSDYMFKALSVHDENRVALVSVFTLYTHIKGSGAGSI